MAEDITLSEARAVIEAAERRGTELGMAFDIAIVDAGNNLKAFVRQDGAWLGSIDIAQSKAYTARAFDMSTADLAPLAQAGGPAFGINAGNDGKIIIFAGGIPLKRGDEVVGAIGVSGGYVEQDQDVAEAGAAAFAGRAEAGSHG
jgi:uncharacterized protein GlcG (DUF336 family)